MLNPQGRVVMVSGASRGIGAAIAQCLCERGYQLSLGARDPAGLGREWDTPQVESFRFDALDRDCAEAWVEGTVERFGRIDAVVNNAGIALRVGLEDDDEDALDAMWEVNVKAPLRLIRLALPHLRSCGAGRIVNVASLSGKRVANQYVGYAMSKFAVVALTHAARRAAWAEGVRATALCPGFVATDMTADVTSHPREEMSDPADLAELVATILALPNTASVAELLVNCRLEPSL